MNKVLAFLNGKKTYLTISAAIIYNILVKEKMLPGDMSQDRFVEFINTVLGFSALGFMRSGMKK